MEETQPFNWTSVTRSLKTSAMLPHQRDEFIAQALREMLTCIPSVGTALIWPCRNGKVLWKVYYEGIKHTTMRRWLSARLDPSLDVFSSILQHDFTSCLSDTPPSFLMPLFTSSTSPGGLWVVWTMPPAASLFSDLIQERMEHVRQTLEAVLEVEDKEGQYFSTSSPLYDRELIDALAHGDAHALSALLSLTRVVGKADFTFWGRAYHDVVEITSHLGAKNGGFGFTLPHGRGIGGRVAAYGTLIARGDYRNSPYREPVVCDIVDSEQIRAGMALPIRYTTATDKSAHVAAVLYATRRTATPFSLAECLLVQRLTRLLEPLPFESRPSSFTVPGVSYLPEDKSSWYDIVLHANRIEMLEAWVSQYIKGSVIVTDNEGYPYVFTHAEQLEQVRAAPSSQAGIAQVISLAAPGVTLPGQIYLCPSISLPPPQWPDFFAELVLACNLIITRMEQAHDQLDRQREQWLRALLKEKPSPHIEQEGYRLGLPIERGQLWVVTWPSGTMQTPKAARKRVIASSVVLETLKSPLLFLESDIAIVLLEGQMAYDPSKVRDALLKHCGAYSLWIVRSGRYHSLHELKMTLVHAISIAQKARREECDEYLLDIYTFGLDSLLENPRLAEDLEAFSTKLLTPLLEYDAVSGAHLTETFVLMQTLGTAQAVAEQLAVHVNTIRYRLHRAEDILGTEQASPKEHMALALAAFTWKHFHPGELPTA